VQFWARPDTTVSKEDQQALCDYFYNIVKENLQKAGYRIVNQPGPDVMRIQIALTDASAATPGLRSVSVVISRARVLNMVQSMATGSYAFVGGAQAEAQITDSTTGERLAASVDKRVGGASLSAAVQWKWGDAKSVMKYWAEKLTTRLKELKTQGKVSQTRIRALQLTGSVHSDTHAYSIRDERDATVGAANEVLEGGAVLNATRDLARREDET
jgi:hypothetical protein